MPQQIIADIIPKQLLANLKKGDCVLFLGADLPLGYEGAPLSRPELATELAKKHSLQPGLTWPDTVDEYLAAFNNDQNGVISFVKQCNNNINTKPGPIHQAIARAGFRGIVSAWYDEMLEQALADAGYRVNRVIRDVQIPYIEEGERDVFVVNLYGSLTDPDSLVLNSLQHEALLVGQLLSRKLQLVTAFATLRPPLFVNFDLANNLPLNLYLTISMNIAGHMKRVYAVHRDGQERFAARWRDINIQLCKADAQTFLGALAAQLPEARPNGKAAIRVEKPPYKFLDYFESNDVDLFCGRDTESQIVTRLAISGRLLTIFGPSGAGKTSLLLAGVVPRLVAEGYTYVYVRALDDPLLALRQEISKQLGRIDQPELDLSAFLKMTLDENNRLLVIFDQFEELFIRVGSKTRQVFFQQLATVIMNPVGEVRFIFSLREDTLARLDEARPYLPDVFTASFRLSELDHSHARVAITEPATRVSMTVEPALVDALVGSALFQSDEKSVDHADKGDLIDKNGRVSPSALQIVLNYLYRSALPAGYSMQTAPPAGLTLTLESYQAVTCYVGEGGTRRELHGAEAILTRYVDEGLAELPELVNPQSKLPLGAEIDLGRALLKVMVTSRSTKSALTYIEMLNLLDEAGELRKNDEVDQHRLQATRLGLEQVRLLRSFERGGVGYYELVHDHLAKAVAASLTEQEMRAKVAHELLHRALDNWYSVRLLIPLEMLKIINEQRQALRSLNTDELELMFRSCLAVGYESLYWFERAAANDGIAVEIIADEGLKNKNFRTRAEAVKALGGLGVRFIPTLCASLADEYPQVRVAAILALEKLQPTGEWRANLKFECYVPAGEFKMGESADDPYKKIHDVKLNAFYIAKYPITNAEYQLYKQDVSQPFEMPPEKENHPVVQVSYYDARQYAIWAGMRLLTEAEWEKAACWEPDQGVKRRYPWGNTFNEHQCNSEESGIGTTTPIGKYSPQSDSFYGVADMAGNVWEWTSSQYQPYPYQPDDGRESLGIVSSRVLRGGSWSSYEASVSCVIRNFHNPDFRYLSDGFRVGCSSGLTS